MIFDLSMRQTHLWGGGGVRKQEGLELVIFWVLNSNKINKIKIWFFTNSRAELGQEAELSIEFLKLLTMKAELQKILFFKGFSGNFNSWAWFRNWAEFSHKKSLECLIYETGVKLRSGRCQEKWVHAHLELRNDYLSRRSQENGFKISWNGRWLLESGRSSKEIKLSFSVLCVSCELVQCSLVSGRFLHLSLPSPPLSPFF